MTVTLSCAFGNRQKSFPGSLNPLSRGGVRSFLISISTLHFSISYPSIFTTRKQFKVPAWPSHPDSEWFGPCQDSSEPPSSSFAKMDHNKHPGLSDDTTPLTQDYDYDDANSEDSSSEVETLRKPLDSFDTEDGILCPEDLEDGLATRSSKGKGWSRLWKMNMRGRRRKQSQVKPDDTHEFIEGFGNDHHGILASICRRSTKKKRAWWYNYCIFGGISGLSVMLVPLIASTSCVIADQNFYAEPSCLPSIFLSALRP